MKKSIFAIVQFAQAPQLNNGNPNSFVTLYDIPLYTIERNTGDHTPPIRKYCKKVPRTFQFATFSSRLIPVANIAYFYMRYESHENQDVSHIVKRSDNLQEKIVMKLWQLSISSFMYSS